MTAVEKDVLGKFKSLLLERLKVHKMVLFGSRARGEAGPYSDMDVIVILANSYDENDLDYVSDCAWKAGFERGIVIVPVVFTIDEWENSPERHSLLAIAVEAEGVTV